MEPFENISRLIAKADKVKQKTAICSFCQGKAPYTLRTVPINSEVLIGAEDMYKPVCKLCHFKNSESAQI